MSRHWRLVRVPVVVLLAAFFCFVGYYKAFGPLAELTSHHAWTTWLPVWLGRTVGWSEMLIALMLAAGELRPRLERAAALAALMLVANQLVAVAFHVAHQETGALPQNAVLIVLLLAAAWLMTRLRSAPS